MTKAGKKRRWPIVLFVVAVCVLLAAPFIIERRVSYYTDGQELRSPQSTARPSIRRVLWETPRALDAAINSPELDDYEPRVSPHGDLLVFTRGRPGENAELWIATRRHPRRHRREAGRGWTDARPLDAINTGADELGAAFSHDGRWLYFYSDRPGGLGGSANGVFH